MDLNTQMGQMHLKEAFCLIKSFTKQIKNLYISRVRCSCLNKKLKVTGDGHNELWIRKPEKQTDKNAKHRSSRDID